jgi:hypothetical protein
MLYLESTGRVPMQEPRTSTLAMRRTLRKALARITQMGTHERRQIEVKPEADGENSSLHL